MRALRRLRERSCASRRATTTSVEIPYQQLSPEALAAVLEEFVTRDGTETASAAASAARVEALLRAGHLKLLFDPETGTTHLVPT